MEDGSFVWLGTNKQDARRKMRRMPAMVFTDPYKLFTQKKVAK